MRLRALADSPFAFSSWLERERHHDAEFWANRAAESELRVSGVVFVAVEDERSVGMAGGFFPAVQRESATLWGMWVDPTQRRKGLGRELVEAVAGWARAAGAHSLRLAVTDCEQSRPAASLYGSLGFYRDGRAGAARLRPVTDHAADGSRAVSRPSLTLAPAECEHEPRPAAGAPSARRAVTGVGPVPPERDGSVAR